MTGWRTAALALMVVIPGGLLVAALHVYLQRRARVHGPTLVGDWRRFLTTTTTHKDGQPWPIPPAQVPAVQPLRAVKDVSRIVPFGRRSGTR